MFRLGHHWRNLSIARRLYVVVGIMATLIAAELVTLRFAMHTLSAVRAFVVGEGLWSKAQKNAIFRLERFARSRSDVDYQAFLEYLKIPEGDRRARIELSKPNPDLAVVRAGFIQGRIHPDDVDPMIDLLRRFSWVSYLSHAIGVWTEGDHLVTEFQEVGETYRQLLLAPKPDRERISAIEDRIETLNRQLTAVESEFSDTLGEGSRWLESVVISILFLAVLLVETIGLTITIRTGRQISRELAEISDVAEAIGRGEHGRRVPVHSRDEIGKLADSVNFMGGMIGASHRDLEERVQERTIELEKAVRARDEFMSIVSHELNTPLAALRLQIQLRKKLLARDGAEGLGEEKLSLMLESDDRQVERVVRLVKEMLDVSRLNTGRFVLSKEKVDLSDLIRDTLQRFAGNFSASGNRVIAEIADGVEGEWDPFRIEQVVTNLLTNAMKYGLGRPITVRLAREADRAVLRVRDEGMGIAGADQTRIFRQFERAISANQISGLGLGLYIAKELVEAHGGAISVQSEPGQGAEFTVEFPFAPPIAGLRAGDEGAEGVPGKSKGRTT
ncbi:MAG: HAMP domain-containing histidine kinase [Bdellovibrionales bacterium]|nr:HAMP domain-containing histidine kinase [Bdellovibrionales bacterium]